ncbi:CHASE2 domain-containing protein, partial [bacterium]|nr:CHASE2 domain-containing protein [bacterium]
MIRKFFALSGFKISIFITLLFLALFSWNYINLGSESFVELMDKKIIDFIQQSKGNTLESDNIAIIAIDTKSVDHFGRWPWGRNIMADLLRELETYYKIRVFAYDALFSEPDSNDISSEKVIDKFYNLVAREDLGSRRDINTLKRIRAEVSAEVNNDAKFGAELSKWNNIVLGYFFFLSA